MCPLYCCVVVLVLQEGGGKTEDFICGEYLGDEEQDEAILVRMPEPHLLGFREICQDLSSVLFSYLCQVLGGLLLPGLGARTPMTLAPSIGNSILGCKKPDLE
jgi:hypothetical protein